MWMSQREWQATQDVQAGLLRQIEDLKQALLDEKARADRAIDQLLVKAGNDPVSPPPKGPSLDELSVMFEDDPDELVRINERIKANGLVSVLTEQRG